MGCENCTCRSHPRYSWEVLNIQQRDLMVVGESPTGVEIRKGEKMTGSGAQVLKETFQKVGLPFSDAEVYYSTALKCAVPKGKGRKIPKDAVSNCHEYLMKEIREVKPKFLVICGATAMQTLLNTTSIKITAEYGRVREYPNLPGTQVMPIMNPGALIHKPGDYKPFLASVQLLSTLYHGGSTNDTGETVWEVLDTPEKCAHLWRRMQKLFKEGQLPYASYDIETTGLDYRIVDFLVLGICFEKNKAYVIPREMRKYAHNFLENIPWRCIWQGGKYDKKVMWKRGLGNVRIDEDTMYQHYVLDETSEHNLGYLSKVYLNAAEYKYKMNQSWSSGSVTVETYPKFFEALCERVAVDCDYTLQLHHKFNAILKEEPTLQKLYKDFLIPAAGFLSRVEQNGILIDAEYLNKLDKEYTELLQKILNDVAIAAEPFWDPQAYQEDTSAKQVPLKFNPGSSKQMSWMVFKRLKLKPRIKKGTSTAKEVLDSIENAPPLIQKVREYRTVQKEHSTYVLGLLNARDTDGRVRTTFNLQVTATGRLSSKEPNVQNQPSANGVGDIRKAFVARPGHVLAEIDYAGAELRWLAALSNCPVLGEIFRTDRNLHTETAKNLFGEHFTKAQKLRAKAMNFGIAYGREAKSIAEEHRITVEEAQDSIDGWMRLYHGAADYLHWCDKQVIQGNYMESPFGRRRRFGLVSQATLKSLQNEARNFNIQSASSDLLLLCAMDLEEPLVKYDTKIINLVHDSMLLEIPAHPGIIAKVGTLCNKVMVEKPKELGLTVPFKTDFEMGINWSDLVTFNYNDETSDKSISWENKDGSMGYCSWDTWKQEHIKEN